MKDENIRYTAKGIDIEERIEKGLTRFFKISENEQAKEFASYKRSYVSECYTRDKDGKLMFAGYTVPS